MDFSWLQSLVFGLVSGIADILPVSAQAHKQLLLNIFGADAEPALLRLIIHLAIMIALYMSCQNHIQRLLRIQRSGRRRRRSNKSGADLRSLADLRFLKIALIPVILGLLIYFKSQVLHDGLIWNAVFLFVNGVILYLPAVLPHGNKDSRSMSPLDGFMVGVGGALSALPGISCVGAASASGMVRGGDRVYALNMALLLNLVFNGGLVVHDVISIATYGVETIKFTVLLGYILASVGAFLGTSFSVRLMRALAAHTGYHWFAYYCWGIGFFVFILYLTV